MTDLRAACDHGRYDKHEYRIGDPGAVRTWRMKQCPGGRDITIDYEAATDQLGLIDWVAMQNKHPSSVEMPPYEWLAAEARAVVAAAIEDTK